jgi:hypothetical protein
MLIPHDLYQKLAHAIHRAARLAYLLFSHENLHFVR